MNPARLMKLPAILTTVTMSDTDVDEMNHPLEVTTSTNVRCWVAPPHIHGHGTETSDPAQVGTIRYLGYFPPCTDIRTTSRVELGAAVYEVDGPPAEWTDPRTCEVIGITALLVRTV